MRCCPATCNVFVHSGVYLIGRFVCTRCGFITGSYHETLLAEGVSTYSSEEMYADFDRAIWHAVCFPCFAGKVIKTNQDQLDLAEPGSVKHREVRLDRIGASSAVYSYSCSIVLTVSHRMHMGAQPRTGCADTTAAPCCYCCLEPPYTLRTEGDPRRCACAAHHYDLRPHHDLQ